MKSWMSKRWFVLAFSVPMLFAAGCDDPAQTSGSGDSSSSGGMTPPPKSLEPAGAVGDSCAPNDGSAIDFTIGVPTVCDAVPNGPQFRFYAYPADTTELAAGQSWSFDMATMGQMGNGQYYPDGIGGNSVQATNGLVEVTAVGAGTVDVHYEFALSTGENYAGDATLTICPSTPLCG